LFNNKRNNIFSFVRFLTEFFNKILFSYYSKTIINKLKRFFSSELIFSVMGKSENSSPSLFSTVLAEFITSDERMKLIFNISAVYRQLVLVNRFNKFN
jgi:hypothetical protein